MEQTLKSRKVWLALGTLVLALLAATRLTGAPHGQVCAEQAVSKPGFAALSGGTNPACIRIVLR
jgi:hypothetical protein